MYKVFIENRLILFCEKSTRNNPKASDIVLKWNHSSKLDLLAFRQILPVENDLVIVSKIPEECMNKVFAGYLRLETAGGIVKRKNSYLFIKRLGFWDLPKGKIEANETPEIAAVREIEEECGILAPQILDLITITYHTYEQKGRLILKKNWWYFLNYSGSKQLIPQQSEDITEAVWLKKKEWSKVLKNTYPSISTVLEVAKNKF